VGELTYRPCQSWPIKPLPPALGLKTEINKYWIRYKTELLNHAVTVLDQEIGLDNALKMKWHY
jgi:hypothetical protein